MFASDCFFVFVCFLSRFITVKKKSKQKKKGRKKQLFFLLLVKKCADFSNLSLCEIPLLKIVKIKKAEISFYTSAKRLTRENVVDQTTGCLPRLHR